MDRRSQSRITVADTVEVTILSAEGVSHDVRFPALTVDMSERGLRIVAPQAIPISTPLRILTPDRLLLGEAMYCREESSDRFVAGIAIEQVLSELPMIQRLAESIWSEDDPTGNSATAPAQRDRRAVS